jgi:hypothetical protein
MRLSTLITWEISWAHVAQMFKLCDYEVKELSLANELGGQIGLTCFSSCQLAEFPIMKIGSLMRAIYVIMNVFHESEKERLKHFEFHETVLNATRNLTRFQRTRPLARRSYGLRAALFQVAGPIHESLLSVHG